MIRDDIATAASTVDGVTVEPYWRQDTQPGHGWVSLARSDRDDTGFGFMDRWTVTIALPQDVRAAEEWIEEHRDALTAAVASELVVTALVPATLTFDTGTTPGLVIEGSRAH